MDVLHPWTLDPQTGQELVPFTTFRHGSDTQSCYILAAEVERLAAAAQAGACCWPPGTCLPQAQACLEWLVLGCHTHDAPLHPRPCSIAMIHRQSRGQLPLFAQGLQAFKNLKVGVGCVVVCV